MPSHETLRRSWDRMVRKIRSRFEVDEREAKRRRNAWRRYRGYNLTSEPDVDARPPAADIGGTASGRVDYPKDRKGESMGEIVVGLTRENNCLREKLERCQVVLRHLLGPYRPGGEARIRETNEIHLDGNSVRLARDLLDDLARTPDTEGEGET